MALLFYWGGRLLLNPNLQCADFKAGKQSVPLTCHRNNDVTAINCLVIKPSSSTVMKQQSLSGLLKDIKGIPLQ